MNTKKYFLGIVILSILIFFIFHFSQKLSLISSDKSGGSSSISILNNLTSKDTVTIDNIEIKVDIADTEALQTKGLSGRPSLDEYEGMLFVFPDDQIRYFWMKDMLISLDIIWIDKEGKIIAIEKNVPKPEIGTPDYRLPIYTSSGSVRYVLEVNSGFSERHNISTNDTVQINQ